MNYKRIYDSLIERANTRLVNGYVEKHHIIPKCIGGDNSKQNLVFLTPEEHFLAHILLVKIYPKNSNLIFAVQQMTRQIPAGRNKRKLYGWLKRKHSEELRKNQIGKNNSQYGTIWINNGAIDKKIADNKIPSGWVRGRIIKKSRNCIFCGLVVDGRKKYCDEHRPTNISKPYKTRYASEEDIKAALIIHNFNIDRAMKHLGYKTTGGNARYKFMKIAELV